MDFAGNGSADWAKTLPANAVMDVIPARRRAVPVFMILVFIS
jgi:hypothetical protein